MNTQKRCCRVICDNGQRISQKDKVAMEVNNHKINKLISVCKNFIKTCKSFFKNIKAQIISKYNQAKTKSPENLKKFKNTAITAVCAGVLICVSSIFFTAGYDVYIDGVHLGSVNEKKDFENIVNEVNDAISGISYGNYSKILEKPVYVMKISLRSDISDADTLRQNVADRSDVIRFGSTLIIDGKAAFTAENEATAKKAVDDVINSYNCDNAKLLTSVDFSNEYVEKNSITSYDSAYLKLRNLLKVETIKNVTYHENIPYGTSTIENNQMYSDEQEIATAGILGEQVVVANVTYINGVESHRDVISTEVITPASTETVIVGTKKRPSDMGTGVMMLPFSGNVSSRFGARDGRRTSHKGVDIAGSSGSPVVAADNGKVIQAEYRYDYGNIIVVDHNNGLTTYYAHLSKMNVSVGDVVEKGQTIGLVGSTGISTGPHLHFEVRRDGTPIDPYSYMD